MLWKGPERVSSVQTSYPTFGRPPWPRRHGSVMPDLDSAERLETAYRGLKERDIVG